MYFDRTKGCVGIASVVGLLTWAGSAQTLLAQGATRDLSGYTSPGVMFTVTITIDPPEGTGVAGVEETPPAGWPVSNISDGGTWDPVTEEVKWAPLFDPSIPAAVTYDVTPPGNATGQQCFSGIAYFDGIDYTIEGDDCISIGIPTISQWGLVVMAVLVLTVGTTVLKRRCSGMCGA